MKFTQTEGRCIVSIGSLPLARFTVLDLCHARAGPTAVRQLADWGANVIKIEPPGEASSDVTGSRREGFDFQNLHRNKRSLTLNLKTEEGMAIFMKLAEKADVIVENFRSEVKFRLGVDYESVKKINPRIVYGSISGFGQTGPYAKRPGVDQIAQGMGGLMSITGMPGQGPVRVGIPIDDLCAGLLLAQGILMALIERETVGRGAVGPHLAARSADLHARFPGLALADGGRSRQAGRQRPSDRHPDRRCSRPRTARSTSPPRATTCSAASARRPTRWHCSTIRITRPGRRARRTARRSTSGSARSPKSARAPIGSS